MYLKLKFETEESAPCVVVSDIEKNNMTSKFYTFYMKC
jgi:hypothetical protein